MLNKLKQLFKKNIYSIYLLIKHYFKNKKGRKFKVNLIEQITITLFKLKYSLPDRILETLFNIDHVTISRLVNRISKFISEIKVINDKEAEYYIVDTTTLRIGKGKCKESYSGYKHHHGIKFQVIVDNNSNIVEVSNFYLSSVHDKKIFLKEYKVISEKIDKSLQILADKAYVGLEEFNVITPSKHNELRYRKDKALAKIENKDISTKRIKVEHNFAYLKKFRILNNNVHYSMHKIQTFFKAISNIFNLSIS